MSVAQASFVSELRRPALPEDWLERARSGESRALEALVVNHQDAIFRLLLRLSGDRELSRDLAQETFVRAFKSLGSFRPGANPGPWLFKIANNLFLDHVRARRPELLGEDEAHDLGQLAGAEDPALTRLADEADLASALAQLPVNWRQAVVLRHVEDLPYEAIAEVLNVPIGTAKTWLFRGRERLKQLLSPQGE